MRTRVNEAAEQKQSEDAEDMQESIPEADEEGSFEDSQFLQDADDLLDLEHVYEDEELEDINIEEILQNGKDEL